MPMMMTAGALRDYKSPLRSAVTVSLEWHPRGVLAPLRHLEG
jgi:hypothetical protein